MKTLTKLSTMAFFFIISILPLFSQETGLINTTIEFNGADRALALYIPANYDAENNYKLLVCLHGMGDKSANYGANLFPYWSQIMPNTILACPDGGDDQSRDYYSPAGDEGIITTALNYIKSNYSIDESEIILQGFSLGGRSAFKYGLDNPDIFKGLLLNTPAFQGILDAKNDPAISLGYNLSAASELPIVIVCGSEDGYVSIDQIMYENVIDNDGIVMYEIVNGMGHSIPQNNYTLRFIDFINNPSPFHYDLELIEVILPQLTNSAAQSPAVKIRNLGKEEVTSVKFNYQNTEIADAKEYIWEGSLKPFQHIDIELPALDLVSELNEVSAEITMINTDIIDENSQNNASESHIIYQDQPLEAPTFQGAEDNNPEDFYWSVQKSGHFVSWYRESAIKKSGDYSLFMFNTPFYFNNRGIAESFSSPYINLSNVENPLLSFDLAHNYLKYGPPNNLLFMDTLEIYISTDNSESYELIYKKFGEGLATAENPLTDKWTMNDCIFYPREDQWRNEEIDLSDYKDCANARFKFNYISGLGGSTNIDNIIFQDKIPESVFDAAIAFSIYPNPATKNVRIDSEFIIDNISIFNLLGEKIFSEDINSLNANIDVSGFNTGAYYIKALANGRDYSKKLLIK